MGVLLVIVLFSVGEWGVEDLVLRIGVRGRINIGGGVEWVGFQDYRQWQVLEYVSEDEKKS